MTARAFALFVALLTIMNLLGDLLWPGFDASIWWISLGTLPVWLSKSLLAVSAFALLVFACWRPDCMRPSPFTAVLALALAGVAAMNVITFYILLATNRIAAGFPLPLSLFICAGMLLVAHAAWSRRTKEPRVISWGVVAGCVVLFGTFPLAQMLFFGNTDYRRPADAIVVFGARVYQDGRLSDALEDRVRTACEIYRHWPREETRAVRRPGRRRNSRNRSHAPLRHSTRCPARACFCGRTGPEHGCNGPQHRPDVS